MIHEIKLISLAIYYYAVPLIFIGVACVSQQKVILVGFLDVSYLPIVH